MKKAAYRERNMEFNNRLYELRKRKGLSQEELASRLNVTRQTVSKWEVGDSTPDMEKLTLISDLFEISLDELVLGKKVEPKEVPKQSVESVSMLKEQILTEQNKKRAKKGLKIVGIAAGILVAVDLLSMIVYFILYGAPK